MPSGDRTRVWFPELIEVLREGWDDDLAGPDLIALRDRLDAMLAGIRTARGIEPPMMWCRQCGERHRAAPSRVSVRSAIVAAVRFGVAVPEDAGAAERRWNRHRKENGLDRYGKPEAGSDDPGPA